LLWSDFAILTQEVIYFKVNNGDQIVFAVICWLLVGHGDHHNGVKNLLVKANFIDCSIL